MKVHHGWFNGSLRALLIVAQAEIDRQVKDDGGGLHMIAAGHLHERLASLGLKVRGIDDGEMTTSQALLHNQAEHIEGISAGGLVGLVIADQAAEEIGGEDGGPRKMLPRKRRFAGTGRADQEDKAEFRDGNLHAQECLYGCKLGPILGHATQVGASCWNCWRRSREPIAELVAQALALDPDQP